MWLDDDWGYDRDECIQTAAPHARDPDAAETGCAADRARRTPVVMRRAGASVAPALTGDPAHDSSGPWRPKPASWSSSAADDGHTAWATGAKRATLAQAVGVLRGVVDPQRASIFDAMAAMVCHGTTGTPT
jgi:hypothetical protein